MSEYIPTEILFLSSVNAGFKADEHEAIGKASIIIASAAAVIFINFLFIEYLFMIISSIIHQNSPCVYTSFARISIYFENSSESEPSASVLELNRKAT